MVIVVGCADRDNKSWWILNRPVTFFLVVFGKIQNTGLELYFLEAEPLSTAAAALSVALWGKARALVGYVQGGLPLQTCSSWENDRCNQKQS